MAIDDPAWVPEACTLPTAQRPVRVAAFDDLFTTALREQRRLSPTVLRWRLDGSAEQRARELTRQESGCCSFFSFEFASADGGLLLDVEVPPGYVDVLDTLAERAAAGMRR